jgi:predicted metalloendopeptidase
MKPHSVRGLVAAVLAVSALDAGAALDVAGIDRSVDACTDFYQFANKSWLAATTIPDDRARWGTMQIIDQNNEKALLQAIEKELRNKQSRYKAKSPERMALDYYQSGMNHNRIEYWAESALLPDLKAAAGATEPAAIARLLGRLHSRGISGGFAFSVDPDAKDSTRYLAEISQGGLGLPERDYYFRDDERTKAQRAAYLKHVARMFELIGDQPEAAERNAATVLAFETELARASMTAVDRRDIDKTYNKRTVAQLAAEAPGFPWHAYFDALGAKGLAELNVSQPDFFKAVGRLATERAADWPTYLRWHIVHSGATKLPPNFEDEHFDFYERQLQGVQAPPPRARRVLRIIGGPYGEQGLGMALG